MSSSVSVGSGGETALAEELASTKVDVGVVAVLRGASEDEAGLGTSVVAEVAELPGVALPATVLLLGAAGAETGVETGVFEAVAVELTAEVGVEAGVEAGVPLEAEAGQVGLSPLRTQPDLAVMAAGQLTSSQSTLSNC